MNCSTLYTKRLFTLAIVVLTLALCCGVAGCNKEKTRAKKDLGTCQTPEEALQETTQALGLLSTNINTGIESVLYINEYEKSKNIIFKTTK